MSEVVDTASVAVERGGKGIDWKKVVAYGSVITLAAVSGYALTR